MSINKVQLITYADSLGGNLVGVKQFLDKHLSSAVSGVHILPFYPSSADRGFAPLTHLEVDPVFGSWEDIKQISDQYELMVDLTVNHISSDSAEFKDYLEKNQQSEFADMFLDEQWFFNKYNVGPNSVLYVYRPRPTRPFTNYIFADGTEKQIWTTFTHQQIDINVETGVSRDLFIKYINHLHEHGAKYIRLDAVGYSVKRPGTNCFLLPETYDYMHWIRKHAPKEVSLLAEVHNKPTVQMEILDSDTVDWVYDFSLPFLTLNSIRTKSFFYLIEWIKMRSPKMFTNLDTHDGIGVIDVEGLLPENEIDDTIAWIEEQGANQSVRASGPNAENVDIYQINCTYYSAVHEDDNAYILARAIQLFLPGIPQIYYVGLLAGKNDYKTLSKTMHGRDINRHNYTWDEIEQNMRRPVVQRLIKLMELRNNHPAFNGEFSYEQKSISELVLTWEVDSQTTEATISLTDMTVQLRYTDPETLKIQLATA